MHATESQTYDFQTGARRWRKASIEALRWTLNDLNEAIALQEAGTRSGAMHCPKLGYYHDERHTVIAELRRRGV